MQPTYEDDISITAGEGALENGDRALVLRIHTNMLELNVWIAEHEIALLQRVQCASWDARGSLRIGRSANSPVFWSTTDTELSILVGHDDETWDFGLRLPLSALQQILAEVAADKISGTRPR